jgi:hypothetical protein
MSPTLVYTAAAVAAALSLAVVPANAQDRRERGRVRAEQSGGEGGERQDGGRRAVPRSSASRQESPARQAPRYKESRQAAAQQAPQFNQSRRYQAPQAGPRGQGEQPYAAPQGRPGGSDARTYSGSQYSNGGSQAPRYSGSQTMPRGAGYGEQGQRAASRGYGGAGGYQSQGPRYDDRSGYAQPGGGYGRDGYRGYVRPPHFQPYRPYYFSRPYYGFRPHLSIGFGVWLGVSVPYPWAYFGTYMPRVYGSYGQGYYGRTYVGVAPAVQLYGGVSFDIQPADADLFVDGEYVGSVGTFTPYGEPLTLYPGVHRIAIVRQGFRTMEFEVAVQPGQVIPYRGMLARW